MILERLDAIRRRQEEIYAELSSAEVQADPARVTLLMKEQASIAPLTETYEAYLAAGRTISESEELLGGETDEEMRALLKEEADGAREEQKRLLEELRILLLPADPNDGRSVIVEVRAGAGGDEAGLFASELCRMYMRYADRRGFRSSMISLSENGIGGIKECTFQIDGRLEGDFFDSEDPSSVPEGTCVRWRMVRERCFDIIKGKRTPLAFRFVFFYPEERLHDFLASADVTVREETVSGLCVNLRFDGTNLLLTTGTSMKAFTADRSCDRAWDSYILALMNRMGIETEQL